MRLEFPRSLVGCLGKPALVVSPETLDDSAVVSSDPCDRCAGLVMHQDPKVCCFVRLFHLAVNCRGRPIVGRRPRKIGVLAKSIGPNDVEVVKLVEDYRGTGGERTGVGDEPAVNRNKSPCDSPRSISEICDRVPLG